MSYRKKNPNSFIFPASAPGPLLQTEQYLHYTVGPALSNPVSCPDVVSIFCQSLHQRVLIGGQFDVVQIQRSGFVPTGLHVTDKQEFMISERSTGPNQKTEAEGEKNKKNKCHVSHVLGSLVLFRFSSAFSSPIPTWQPRASRVLQR